MTEWNDCGFVGDGNQTFRFSLGDVLRDAPSAEDPDVGTVVEYDMRKNMARVSYARRGDMWIDAVAAATWPLRTPPKRLALCYLRDALGRFWVQTTRGTLEHASIDSAALQRALALTLINESADETRAVTTAAPLPYTVWMLKDRATTIFEVGGRETTFAGVHRGRPWTVVALAPCELPRAL